jgi:hypothetical protein
VERGRSEFPCCINLPYIGDISTVHVIELAKEPRQGNDGTNLSRIKIAHHVLLLSSVSKTPIEGF